MVLAALLFAASVGAAQAYWTYAQWGMTETQLMAASGGQAVPCRPDVPVCAPPPGGAVPSHYVESLTMVGMPASAAFAFDGQGQLNQTAVLFPRTDSELMSGLLGGIHGEAVEGRPGDPTSRFWRDQRRGSLLTVIPAGLGVWLLYRPAPAP
ncbi:hypothetical protein BH11PSE3_BH11PSE3_26160 [soil metagenome]